MTETTRRVTVTDALGDDYLTLSVVERPAQLGSVEDYPVGWLTCEGCGCHVGHTAEGFTPYTYDADADGAPTYCLPCTRGALGAVV